MHPVIHDAISKLYEETYKHVINFSLEFHTNKSMGELAGKVDLAINSFPNIIWPVFFGFLPLFLEVFISFSFLTYSCGYEYGFGLILTMLSIGFFSYKVSGKAQSKFYEANNARLSIQNKFVDGLLNFENLKIFGVYSKELKIINKFSKKRSEVNTKSFQHIEFLKIIQTIFLFSGVICIFFMSMKKVVNGELSLGQFIMIHAYLVHFTIPLQHYIELFKILNIAFSQFKYIGDIIEQPTVKNGPKIIFLGQFLV